MEGLVFMLEKLAVQIAEETAGSEMKRIVDGCAGRGEKATAISDNLFGLLMSIGTTENYAACIIRDSDCGEPEETRMREVPGLIAKARAVHLVIEAGVIPTDAQRITLFERYCMLVREMTVAIRQAEMHDGVVKDLRRVEAIKHALHSLQLTFCRISGHLNDDEIETALAMFGSQDKLAFIREWHAAGPESDLPRSARVLEIVDRALSDIRKDMEVHPGVRVQAMRLSEQIHGEKKGRPRPNGYVRSPLPKRMVKT